jgi:hypothetical protein
VDSEGKVTGEEGNEGESNSGTGDNSENVNNNDGSTVAKIWFATDGNEYSNGGIIDIPFSSEDNNLAFQLKHYPETTENFQWAYIQEGVDRTVEVKNNDINLDNFGLNIGNRTGDIKLKVTYSNDNQVEVTLNVVKEEFETRGLKAIDVQNNQRVAANSEVLYLIDPNSISDTKREVRYEHEINPDLDRRQYSDLDIVWSYQDQTINQNLQQEFGIKKITRELIEGDKVLRTSVSSGYPDVNEKELSVDVQWIESKKQVLNMTDKFKKFLDFFKVVNEVSDAVETVAPCETSFLENFDRNMTWQWVTFNAEDPESRHVLETKRFEFAIDAANIASFGCKKGLAVSVFGYSVSLGEIYFNFSAGANISIRNDEIFYVENQQQKDKYTYTQGGIKVSGKGGIKGGVGHKDEDGKTVVGIFYDANVDITGGGRIVYPYKGNSDEIAGVLYINPLMYNFIATAQLGPLAKDFKYSDILWDIRKQKRVVYNMETSELTYE